MTRKWTKDELAALADVPVSWPRQAKLTPELVKAIRERTDSLSQPWTLQELAYQFGVDEVTVAQIARRQSWDDPVYEPKRYKRD